MKLALFSVEAFVGGRILGFGKCLQGLGFEDGQVWPTEMILAFIFFQRIYDDEYMCTVTDGIVLYRGINQAFQMYGGPKAKNNRISWSGHTKIGKGTYPF